jgi:hypothetical protein
MFWLAMAAEAEGAETEDGPEAEPEVGRDDAVAWLKPAPCPAEEGAEADASEFWARETVRVEVTAAASNFWPTTVLGSLLAVRDAAGSSLAVAVT